MSIKRLPITSPAGFNEVALFLEFITDAKAVQARIDQLETLRSDINTRLSALNTLDEAEALLARARIDRTSASDYLAEASEKRAHAMREAKADADKIVADAKANQALIEAEIRQSRFELEEDKKWVSEQSSDLSRREVLLKQQNEAAEKLMAQAQAIKGEFEEKLVKLRAAGVL